MTASGDLSVAAMEQAFAVYFNEMEKCRRAECYFALLHIISNLPDICAALESDDGKTSGPKYEDSCNRFMRTEIMNGADWWEIRCRLLHHGRTKTREGRIYKFVQPAATARAHRVVWGSRDTIALDVRDMSFEIEKSIRAWFDDLQEPYLKLVRANVKQNLESLVIVRESELPGITGIIFTATAHLDGQRDPIDVIEIYTERGTARTS